MVEFSESEFSVRKGVGYCAYGRPYRKSTRIWTNLRQWVPQARTGNGRCSGKGKCQSMVGSNHPKTAAGGGDRVRGRQARQVGSAAGAHGPIIFGGGSEVECGDGLVDGRVVSKRQKRPQAVQEVGRQQAAVVRF